MLNDWQRVLEFTAGRVNNQPSKLTADHLFLEFHHG
jgi:hypothetical protein